MGVAAALPGGHEQRGIPADAREDAFHCTPSSLPTDCLVKRAERTASERRGNRYGQNVSHSLVATSLKCIRQVTQFRRCGGRTVLSVDRSGPHEWEEPYPAGGSYRTQWQALAGVAQWCGQLGAQRASSRYGDPDTRSLAREACCSRAGSAGERAYSQRVCHTLFHRALLFRGHAAVGPCSLCRRSTTPPGLCVEGVGYSFLTGAPDMCLRWRFVRRRPVEQERPIHTQGPA